MDESDNSFYFVEFHELSGSISLNQTMLQVYTFQKNFDGLMVCFDLGNLTSLQGVNKLIQMGLDAVEASRNVGNHRQQQEFTFQSSGGSDMTNRLQAIPVVVAGCKADTIDKSSGILAATRPSGTGVPGVDRLKRMNVNAQVLNELKKIDEGSLIDYIEAGLSVHRGVYKVPQDDF